MCTIQSSNLNDIFKHDIYVTNKNAVRMDTQNPLFASSEAAASMDSHGTLKFPHLSYECGRPDFKSIFDIVFSDCSGTNQENNRNSLGLAFVCGPSTLVNSVHTHVLNRSHVDFLAETFEF